MKNSTPKHILLIRNAFQGDFGGAENYALRLADELQHNGYVVTLVTKVPELLSQARKSGIHTIKGRWYAKQGWGRIYRLIEPAMILWYLYIIVRHKIDIIHAHGRDDFIFATTAAKLMRKKVIWTDHADLKYIIKDHSAPPANKILNLAKYATAVVAVSNSEKDEILRVAPHFPNLIVVHNGVNSSLKSKPIKKQKGVSVVGSTARLVDTKGIRELLTAFAQMQAPNIELWLIGKGPQEDEYHVLCNELNISSRVKFLGHKKNVWPYLLAMDIFVLPTYHEAFSMALLEAGAAGKAVVATKTGGNPEVINQDTGILVPIKNAKKLTDAIQQFIDDPRLRKKKGLALQKLVHKNFNFTEIVKNKIIPLYEKP